MFVYRSILREPPTRPSPWSAAWSAWPGIGTAFGISLMALAWHLSSQSYQAGNLGYSGSEQARPAFAVLAIVVATAATIALACRAGAGTSGAAQGGEPVRCGSRRDI
jgi:hypothetical protein